MGFGWAGGAPVLEAVMAPSMAIAVDVDNISGQDTYKDLITKIKVRPQWWFINSGLDKILLSVYDRVVQHIREL